MNNILITFASWEDRFLLGFQRDIEKYPIGKVCLLKFEPPVYTKEIEKKIENNERVIQAECSGKQITLELLPISRSDVDRWHKLDDFVKNLNSDESIHIDITTMPRYIIWTLLFFLKQKYKHTTIIYHRPQKYGTWLTRDPDTPQLLFKHSGIIEFGKPTTLFVLSGYDEERVIQLIHYYEPQSILIGECNQHDNYRYGMMKRKILDLEKCDYDTWEKVEGVFDIEQCDNEWGYNIIENIIENKLKTSNLIVAPLGPKTGAVSVYQCFMKYPQIALAYVPSKEFNIDYSKGIGETLIKEIDIFSQTD